MRPFQLSAVLVSAAMLLSGCYLGRGSFDRSRLERAETEDEACHVSGVPIVGDVVLAAASVPAALFTIFFQAISHSDSTAGLFFVPLGLGALFLADGIAGYAAVRECSEVRGEWRSMKAGHAPQPMKPVAPQPPAWGAPQPSEPIPSQPPEK
jgi:hypothetical protein